MLPQQKNDDEAAVQSFVDDHLSASDRRSLEWELQSFAVRHASHHRPIALVSSGGTVADLEVHSVRCVDNFSTGLRGAISVEELLKRGYAVVHLWRQGSASPYGRLLGQSIGLHPPNQGITMASLGKLFATGDLEDDLEDQLVQSVLDAEAAQHQLDPWLSDPSSLPSSSTGRGPGSGGDGGSGNVTPKRSNNTSTNGDAKISGQGGGLRLHRRIVNSTALREALAERHSALEDGRILTISFRSVEEYLAKLQLSAIALKDSQALAMFFLAAAVSDFYVPLSERSTHKIQSGPHQTSSSPGLTLHLRPVPKVMGLLRTKWAPDAFVCSFKLETDKALLRQKAEGAVQKYGCHMVIGNILETRHDQVWILAPPDMQALLDEGDSEGETNADNSFDKSSSDRTHWTVQEWPMQEVAKRNKSSAGDGLEARIMEHVVQTHFEYISCSSSGSFDKSGTAAVVRAHEALERKRQQVEREAYWSSIQKVAMEWAGIALGALLSYGISAAMRRRMNP